MAMIKAEFADDQTDAVVISAVPGRIILVLRLLATAESNGALTLKSDPGGPGSTAMTPALHVQAFNRIDLLLGRRYGLATERGKAFGLSSVINGLNKAHGVIVWYELVD